MSLTSAPHIHDEMDHPGVFSERPLPLRDRDYTGRAFTVGVGGPVGSGKTALMLALCLELRDRIGVAAVTNDIFTREDGEFLIRHGALPAERIRAVETGGCPHAAIREDISANLLALEDLHDSRLLLHGDVPPTRSWEKKRQREGRTTAREPPVHQRAAFLPWTTAAPLRG